MRDELEEKDDCIEELKEKIEEFEQEIDNLKAQNYEQTQKVDMYV